MRAVAIDEVDALELDAKRPVVTRQMMGLPAGIHPLPLALMLDANEGGGNGVVPGVALEHLDVAHEVGGARHRGEHERSCLQEPLHANGQDRVILIDDRRDVERISLVGLARHPVDALRRVELEPCLELPAIQEARFPQDQQLDLALYLVGKPHAASRVMQSTQAVNCTRIGISLAAPEMLPFSPRRSLSSPREKSIQGPVSRASPCWQRSSISTSSEKIIDAGEPSVVMKRIARWKISSGAPLSRKQWMRTMVRPTATGMVTGICCSRPLRTRV